MDVTGQEAIGGRIAERESPRKTVRNYSRADQFVYLVANATESFQSDFAGWRTHK